MSRKAFKYSALLASVLLAAALGGCGSDSRDSGASLDSVAKVGDTKCIQCHSAVTEALTGESIVAQYQQNSPHNQDGLGCESCHGGGAMHNGVGPIPYPAPDANRCATCHDGVTSFTVAGVATVAPATNANTAFATSNHVEGTPSHTSGLCIRCHTHEGAVLSNKTGFTGDTTILGNAAYAPSVTISSFSAFSCNTCHQHGAGLRGVMSRDSSGNLVPWNPSKSGITAEQFNLCTSCHNLYNYNQTKVIASGSVASGTQQYEHSDRWTRSIAITHREKAMVGLMTLPFANMTTGSGTDGTQITGYAIRIAAPTATIRGITGTFNTDPSYKGPCMDCHGHEAKTNTGSSAPADADRTVHTDWAQSGHAGGLLTAKYTAAAGSSSANFDSMMQAFVGSSTNSWSHYNWDSTFKSDGVSDDRGSCQKCHTSTGISNYLNAPTTYTPAGNNFSHLAGWNPKGGSNRQNELLYCWGCHKDAGTGALRNPGAITTSEYTYNSAAIQFPNVGNSNVCVACHSGRGNVDSIKASRGTRWGSKYHHAPAAATLFSSRTHMGYEFTGADYTNKSYFEHDKIGTADAPGTGSNGPCAACHMSGSSHTYNVLTDDGTAIRSQALCNVCHTTHPMTKTVLDEQKAGYEEAGAIATALAANTIPNHIGVDITTNYADTTLVPIDYFGAAQNSFLPADEPGGFAHNRYYVKRLLFDSIDFLTNGSLTGSITIDATTYPNAAVWYGAPAGTTGSYTATRP